MNRVSKPVLFLLLAVAVVAGTLVLMGQAKPKAFLPGLTVADEHPNGCVDCHKNQGAGKDYRLNVSLAQIKGHPKIDAMVKKLPDNCAICHKAAGKVSPLDIIMHKVHYARFREEPLRPGLPGRLPELPRARRGQRQADHEEQREELVGAAAPGPGRSAAWPFRYENFSGGYSFKRFAGRPEDTLVEAPLPVKVRLALRSAAGADLTALVKNGETVKAGQALALEGSGGASVLATVSGRIEELKPAAWLGGKTKVATIAADGSADWTPLAGPSPDWRTASPEALRELALRSGAAALPAQAAHLVVQAAEDEPHNPNPEVLLQAWGLEALLEGLAILGRPFPGVRLHLALHRRRRALAARIEQAAAEARPVPGAARAFRQIPPGAPRGPAPHTAG